ncbi:mitotic checkpoint regulator, MAD2B-interacting-domain-containing protein [Gongronella butleri]|nr:mitotic checkpoint regulator, MAD2B-interacting-domain-containing protein [Gongronella butleri]
MSLVANYDSSSGSEAEDDHVQVFSRSSQPSKLAQLLPQPKNTSKPPSKGKKPVFIVPTTLETADDDDDEDEQPKKRLKTTSKGASLTDLLPAPKNSSLFAKKPATATTSAMARPAPQHHEPETASIDEEKDEEEHEDDEEEEEEEEDEEEEAAASKSSSYTGSFFRLGDQLKQTPSLPAPRQAHASTSQPPAPPAKSTQMQPPEQPAPELDDPNAMYAYGADPNAYAAYYHSQEQYQHDGYTETLGVDALSELGGKRRGDHAGVNIIDVNQSDMLPDENWRRQAMEMMPKMPVPVEGAEANSLQKKKNNIVALAAQARSMQHTLEDQYAKQRVVKNEARKRYGF